MVRARLRSPVQKRSALPATDANNFVFEHDHARIVSERAASLWLAAAVPLLTRRARVTLQAPLVVNS
jgi:hypothetical protein